MAVAQIYVWMIERGETNPETGSIWKIEDVPALWRQEVERLISEQAD